MRRPSPGRRVPIPDRDPLTWGRTAPPEGPPEPRGLVRGAVVFYLAMATAGTIAMQVTSGAEVWSTRLLGPRPGLSIALGLSLGLLLVAVSRALETWAPIARLLRGFEAVLGRVPPTTALLVALTSAIGEEFLFRGALQPWLGPWLTSVIFAALHVPLDRDFLFWPVFAFGAGLAFAFAMESSGSLVAPILAHFTVNWLNLRRLGR